MPVEVGPATHRDGAFVAAMPLAGAAVPGPTTLMGVHLVLMNAAVGVGGWVVVGAMMHS